MKTPRLQGHGLSAPARIGFEIAQASKDLALGPFAKGTNHDCIYDYAIYKKKEKFFN